MLSPLLEQLNSSANTGRMLPARERRKTNRGDRQIECLEGFEKWRYQRVGFFNVINSLVWFVDTVTKVHSWNLNTPFGVYVCTYWEQT